MKSLWNSFKIAFAMFSKIPVPQAEWSKENMKYMFCFFPFVGAVIAGITLAAAYAGSQLGFSENLVTVVLVLLPVLVTGGIHVDGLLDTSDAMSSWQERGRRLEILKDSNAGAFAVITACVYFFCWYGAYSQMSGNFRAMCVMGAGFMVSRCFAGIGVITLPKAREDGTVAEFSRKSEDRPVRNVLLVYLLLLLVLMLYIHPIMGVSAYLTAVLIFIYYRNMSMKYFGGITGDLSGCFLCICEVGMALVLAVVSNFTGA
mgnify:CR=1 FL=1